MSIMTFTAIGSRPFVVRIIGPLFKLKFIEQQMAKSNLQVHQYKTKLHAPLFCFWSE